MFGIGIKTVLKQILAFKSDEEAETVTSSIKGMKDRSATITLTAADLEQVLAVLPQCLSMLGNGLLPIAMPSDGNPGKMVVLKPDVLSDPNLKATLDRHGPWEYILRK